MAKELPYFKFEPAEWLVGRISREHFELQGAYINLCAFYWHKLGDIDKDDSRLRVGDELYQNLIDRKYIQEDGDYINISWLDTQLAERKAISKVRSEIGKKGALAKQLVSKSQAIGKQKRREENRVEENIPAREEFIAYCLEKKPTIDPQHAGLKYDAWMENGWRDGNGKPVKNWKAKANNTIPHLKTKEKKQTFSDGY